MGMDITGVNKLNTQFKALKNQVPEALGIGLLEAGDFLRKESQKIVPVDKRNPLPPGHHKWQLHDSARVTKISNEEVIVSYDTDYAVVQHENLEYVHSQGRRAKYLEEPARTKRKEMGRIVKGWAAKAFKR